MYVQSSIIGIHQRILDLSSETRKSEQITSELFTIDGKRNYLIAEEQGRFIASANAHERAEVRTFCLTLAHTGCRISEALELTPERVDLSDKSITFRTLKQRDKIKYRSVPCPDTLLDAVELVHSVRKARRSKKLKVVQLDMCPMLGKP